MAYSGLYRAKVVQHGDERQKGRIKVTIPDISGGKGKSQWVDLCMNCAYENGGDIAVPKLGDTCWIAFERGDINLPVYMGNFFGAFKTPLPDYDEDTRVISWDSCRIEMKGETMKFIVGEKSLITITTDTISLEVGENEEGTIDTEYINSSEEGDETSSGGNGRSSIVMTLQDIKADSKEIIATAKTMACVRATSEVSIMGKHIGLNDKAANSAMKKVPLTSALSTSSFAQSFGNLGVGDALKGGTFTDLAGGLTENIKTFGTDTLNSVLESVGVTSALENFNFTSVLDGLGNLNSVLSPDALSTLASDMGLLSAVGGLDNLNSMLDTSKFSDLTDMPDISDVLGECGSLKDILPKGITGTLKEDIDLHEVLGLQTFNDMPFTDALQIEGVAEMLSENGLVLTDILSDKGMARASQNDEFVAKIMEDRYREKIEGDEAFEDFNAEEEISRLSDETFLVTEIEEEEETEEGQ